MGAADAIADMAQRVQLNGPEPTYASEKLSYASTAELRRQGGAEEALRTLCDVELARRRSGRPKEATRRRPPSTRRPPRG